jgi:hypothetical protein
MRTVHRATRTLKPHKRQMSQILVVIKCLQRILCEKTLD